VIAEELLNFQKVLSNKIRKSSRALTSSRFEYQKYWWDYWDCRVMKCL